jgi:hypothetical protein
LERRIGDHAIKRIITKSDSSQPVGETALYLFDDWFDPIEALVRDRVRGFIQAMIEGELDETLMRPRYGRLVSSSGKNDGLAAVAGHRHGHRSRSLTGTFGRTEIAVPRARLVGVDGKTTEWKSKVLRTYQRRTLAADALIASAYLAGTNTRRVRRVLKALFAEGIGKDVVSRVWRKVRSDREAWNARPLVEEPIVRLILDGTVARVRLDRKATSISLLVVIGVRADGQKVLLAIKSMGGESTEAWRALLDDLIKRGLVADMDAPSRIIEKFGGLLQVFQPSDALFLFNGNARWIDLSFERRGSFEFVPGPEFDRAQPQRQSRGRNRKARMHQYSTRRVQSGIAGQISFAVGDAFRNPDQLRPIPLIGKLGRVV